MNQNLIKKILLETSNSSLYVYENATPEYFEVFDKLDLNIKPTILVYGRECHQQRDIKFFSDESQGYRYSNTISKSASLTSELKFLLSTVNEFCNTSFNGILVNKYNNGSEYLSAHSDSLTGLDNGTVVALSYGATRNFRIRDKQTNKIVLNYDFKSTTMLVMDGKFQEEFKHEIPCQKKIKDARISLTFRKHIN